MLVCVCVGILCPRRRAAVDLRGYCIQEEEEEILGDIARERVINRLCVLALLGCVY